MKKSFSKRKTAKVTCPSVPPTRQSIRGNKLNYRQSVTRCLTLSSIKSCSIGLNLGRWTWLTRSLNNINLELKKQQTIKTLSTLSLSLKSVTRRGRNRKLLTFRNYFNLSNLQLKSITSNSLLNLIWSSAGDRMEMFQALLSPCISITNSLSFLRW
jgi:hypothetical protein